MIPATDTLEQTTGRHPIRRVVRRIRRRGVVVASITALAVVGVLSATLRSRRADSEASAAPFTILDSLRADSVPSVAIAPPLPPPPPLVDVVAPGDANVTINGISVGRGRWKSDTLKPGTYEVAARVRSYERCASARDVDTVHVLTTGETIVTLQPRACGFLAVASTPERAEFSVLAANGASVREGTLPLPDSLLLPVGRYRLRLRARYCTQFEDSVRIEPGKTNHQQIPMICSDTTQKG